MFEDVGNWKRARYFPRAGEDMHAAVQRECRAVREGVGLFDASTLGKIDLQGRDGAEFLNRVYTNAWTKLEVGRCRYGLMLRDDGMVFDDGVTARLGPGPLPHDHDHRRRRARAGLAGGMAADRVAASSRSTAPRSPSSGRPWRWSGPKAREVLRAAGTDLDLGNEALPHLAFKEGRVAGIPARVFRISFSGEIAYEVNVPWGYGAALWEALWAAGQPLGDHRLRHREHARAAGREGLHHRRPGHGRHGHAVRPRHGLDRRQGQAGLHRQARAAQAGVRRAGPQAARRAC